MTDLPATPTIPTPAGGIPVAPQPSPQPPGPSTFPQAVEGVLTTLASASAGAEPGYTTTEFWVTLATEGIGLLTLTGVIHPAAGLTDAVGGIVATVVPAVVYAVSRGIRKAGTPG